MPGPVGALEEGRPVRSRWGALALLYVIAAHPAQVSAGSYTVTISDTTGVRDSYLRQDTGSQYGTAQELRLKTDISRSRNTIVKFPVTSLGNKTVLQAWLGLRQYAGSSSMPLDARVYPVTESWDELRVNWTARDSNVLWTRPGGTRGAYWSGRALVSAATNNGRVSWQVGPIIRAWQAGDLPNLGLLIEGLPSLPIATETYEAAPIQISPEIIFRSREYTDPAQRPSLLVYYTDEPPAIQNGTAELQPSAVPARSQDVPFTLWLEVDAERATPSGRPTGFNGLALVHKGALKITAFDGMVSTGGPSIDPGLSWNDDGTTFTVGLPRITGTRKLGLKFRADVLSAATGSEVELPVYLDDTATPAVWAQVLWPGNADGVDGNGDSWNVLIQDSGPHSIDLVPDSASVLSTRCISFELFGTDSLGNRFPLVPDELRVSPAGFGSIDETGQFCAADLGPGRAGSCLVIASYGTLTDTSRVTILPALYPQFTKIELADPEVGSVNALAPLDTMFVNVEVSDGDGFGDITGLDFRLSYRGHEADHDAPAYRAAFQWRRGSSEGWAKLDPAQSTWSLVRDLCSIDTLSGADATAKVRLAFVPGMIARASSEGEWTVAVTAISSTPEDTSGALLTGLDAVPFLRVTSLDLQGFFAPGEEGATRLPLASPPDGRLDLLSIANVPYVLQASVEDLVGLSAPAETLRVGPPEHVISWAFEAADSVGFLGNAFATLGDVLPPLETEDPTASDLFLWTDLPVPLSPQLYRGDLRLRLEAPSLNQWSLAEPVWLIARVASSGLAAKSAVAEALPHVVQAGTTAQVIDALVYPTIRAGDTGIDRLLVTIPEGYGTPRVTSVTVAGLPVTFADSSRAGLAAVALGTALNQNNLIDVRFEAGTPTKADSSGADFVVLFDDSRNSLEPQTAVEGDANTTPDGDNWRISVAPGPLASVQFVVDSTTCFVDSTVTFSVSATDQYGNPVFPEIRWSVIGSTGVIDSVTGVFRAVAAGVGRVVARSETFADTAVVIVRPYRGISILSVHGPDSVYQGQSDVAMQVLLENSGVVTVTVDSVRLAFSRGAPGSANGDFTAKAVSGVPVTLAGGQQARVEFQVEVRLQASTGTISVDAAADGHAPGGEAVSDGQADSVQVLALTPGGITVEAFQSSATVRPGYDLGNLIRVTVRNLYPEKRSLTSLIFTNTTRGPGDQDKLDQELGELALYRESDPGFLNSADTLLLQTVALAGEVHFAPLNLGIPARGEVRLVVRGKVPLEVRDSDALDLSIERPEALTFETPVGFQNAWPVAPAGASTIDGMTWLQVRLRTIGSTNFMAGSNNNLALDLVVPANGYAPDRLDRFDVVNLGTATAASDIGAIKLWADDGDGVFAAGTDRLVRSLTFTGNRWEATNLLETVPVGGIRVFTTIDVKDLATDGLTVRLAVPDLPDVGIGMTSGNDGPIDQALENPEAQSVSTVNRITFNAVPIAQASVNPGAQGVMLHHLVATNTYSMPRTLNGIVFRNTTVGSGTPAQLDREVAALELRSDGDADGVLDDATVDPAIGSAIFSEGRAVFSGLQWALAPGASRHLFLTADVSLSEASDGDTLGTDVGSALDFSFTEATAVAASLPLDSHGAMAVDGMVAAQFTVVGAPGITLGADDGPVSALDVIVPANGYTADVLNQVHVVNLGDAGVPEIAELRLWRDGGDGLFSAGTGDDRDLGPLAWAGGSWQSGPLTESLSGTGARLFVSLIVSSSPAESTTVRLAFPVGGITCTSGNDGPLDQGVTNPQALLISDSPLLATLELAPQATTVGGLVTLRMIVRNKGSETVLGVAPSAPTASGDGRLTIASGPTPASFDLPPAASDTFLWTYTADSSGSVQLTASAEGVGATSGLQRRSLNATSPVEQIFTQLSQLELLPIQSMPGTINRGQTDVVPLSLTLSNNGGASASDARVLGLRVRLEDETGAGIVPSQLLSRVAVNEGTNVYLVKTALETSGSEVDLTLATPVLVRRLEPVTLSLRLDILDSTLVTNFRVVVLDSSWFTAQDATSGAPVAVALASGSFPLLSGIGRIVIPAVRLEVQGLASQPLRVEQGRIDAPLLGIRLNNPDVGGVSSNVRLTAFDVTLSDTNGVPLPEPADFLDRLTLRSGAQALATRLIPGGEGAHFTLALNPPLTVPVNVPLDLAVSGDVAASATLGALRLALRGPSTFLSVDATTGDSVPAVFAVDPIAGATLRIEAVATVLTAAGSRRLPSTVVVGEPNVLALEATLTHPGVPGVGRIRVDSLTILCRNETGAGLVPGDILARVRVYSGALLLGSLIGLPSTGSSLTVPFGVPPLLEPGQSLPIQLVIDASPSAPATFFELTIPGSGIGAVDANTSLPVTAQGQSPLDLPLLSGLSRLAPPARDLTVELSNTMPAVWAGDGSTFSACVLALVNAAASGSGSIFVDRLALRGADRGFGSVSVGSVASRVQAWVNDQLWAETAALAPDSSLARMVGDTLEVAPDQPVQIEIRMIPRTGVQPPSFRLGIDEPGVGVIQPASALLTVRVLPQQGSTFPLWTEAGGPTLTTLKESYANFPNPFAAGREVTSFVYYLPAAGQVTLTIWTARGDRVATLFEGASRPAGLNQTDRWDGRNGRGDVVLNGVYVAELVAQLADGRTERVLRKLAVMR